MTTTISTNDVVRGSRHRLVTDNGSDIHIDSEVDRYGRCHSHVITGYDPLGYSRYFARNVRASQVCPLVRRAEEEGWTHIYAGVEFF